MNDQSPSPSLPAVVNRKAGVEIMAPTHGLLDMTVYGRQETWEDSPDGWPQPWGDAESPEVWRTNGRPIAQWSRIEAGFSDRLA